MELDTKSKAALEKLREELRDTTGDPGVHGSKRAKRISDRRAKNFKEWKRHVPEEQPF